jgi:hypothetical protein
MKSFSRLIAAGALAAMTATSVGAPAYSATRHHKHHYYGRTHYRHKVCRRSPPTTGTIVGGGGGAGHGASMIGHRLRGPAAGAVGGAVAGGAVDRSMTARYRCYYTR